MIWIKSCIALNYRSRPVYIFVRFMILVNSINRKVTNLIINNADVLSYKQTTFSYYSHLRYSMTGLE